jgi:hypothetical protein
MQIHPFWNVSHNLFAIYEATCSDPSYTHEDEDQLYKNLIPNLTCLNDNRNVNFSTNNHLNNFLNCSLFKPETRARIKAALDYTHALFHQYQERLMDASLPEFENCLMVKINNGSVDKRLCKETQEKIQKFHDYTQYFFIEVQAERNKKLTTLFKKHFCEDCLAHVDRLQENYAIITLQGEIGDELPLRALIDASYGNKEENSELKNFVKTLAAKNSDISTLHSAFNGIVDHAKKFHQTEANKRLNRVPDLATLESHLYDLNKQVFSKVDKDLLVFRDSLKVDFVLSTEFYDEENGKNSTYTITLGKQIGEKGQSEFDNNLFFEIKTLFKDQEEQKQMANSCVIWITINKALAGIKWVQNQSCNIIQPATIRFIDNQGRFALVDKLQSLPNGSFNSNEKFYECIARWIGWQLTQSITLDNLNIDNIMLAKHPIEGNRSVITSIKVTKPLDKFSYSKLEQIVYDISKGDQRVFHFIMNQSGLSQTDDAVYIKTLVHASFKPEIDPEREAIGKTFKDKSTPLGAIKLQQDIAKMKDECLKILKLSHKAISPSELEQKILEKYDEKGCVSILWPTLQAEIITTYISS